MTLGFFYGRLAWQSIRRNPGLAALMVGGLAVGIATWVTARAAIQGALRDPLPDKAGLYHVSVVRPPIFADVPSDGTISDNRMESGPRLTVSETEARAILAARRGRGGAISPTMAGRAAVRPPTGPLLVGHLRFATRDLFGLFDLELAEGALWTPDDDAAGNPVLIIDGETARAWFGAGGALGRTVAIAGTPFRVVGVLAGGPREKLYDQVYFGHQTERFFVPFEAHRRFHINPEYGFQTGAPGPRADELSLFVWADLPTAAERDALLADAAAAGLPLRLLPFAGFRGEYYHLHPAYYLLDLFAKVTLIASALNLVRLLLAKFSARADLSGIHRALGASRRSIVLVHVIEAKLIGIGAGIAGLALAAIAVPILNALVPDRIADATIDGTAVLVTVAVAVVVGMVAGIYPAWRATQQPPAVFLRGA